MRLITHGPVGTHSNISQDYARFDVIGNGKHHTGMDILVPEGTTVSAAADGIVRSLPMTPGIFNGDNHCMGNVVIVDHGLGLFTLYAYLLKKSGRTEMS